MIAGAAKRKLLKKGLVGLPWLALAVAVLSWLASWLTGPGWLIALLGLALALAFTNHLYTLNRLKKALAVAARQHTRLTEYQERDQQRQQLETNLKEEIGQTIQTLSATASEQALDAAQQVSAVVQLGSLMTELSQVAAQVTERSRRLEQAALAVLGSTEQVASTTHEVAEAGLRGHEAVANTIASNQQVLEVYQRLNQSFAALLEQSRQIGQIVGLIEMISRETNLLAFNALIEAAGAGVYGDRFGVVAHEVKALADKTQVATSQIKQIVTQTETALGEARDVMTSGEDAIQSAFNVARESGVIITQFEAMVNEAVQASHNIGQLATTMQTQATEIGFAIRLQQNSGEQALEALTTVQRIAQATAVIGEQIASSVVRLEDLSGHILSN